jgi:hypothetical protein
VYTVASGNRSHAEGDRTNATGPYSHAEGYKSTASGEYSHAEGYNTLAAGNYSHTEGSGSVTYYKDPVTNKEYTGPYGHAEGQECKALNTATHAEGRRTKAMNTVSHAEGDGTITNAVAQHVQGKYNDLPKVSMAHIVGNGTSSARSNAHTLDWEGNAWYQGDVYVGGTSQDVNSKKLATEEYVDTELANLVNSAPETLDTLGEIATAMQENADVVETLNSAITTKADKVDLENYYNKIEIDSYEFISIADIDEICNAVTEGSLESTDVDELINKLQ